MTDFLDKAIETLLKMSDEEFLSHAKAHGLFDAEIIDSKIIGTFSKAADDASFYLGIWDNVNPVYPSWSNPSSAEPFSSNDEQYAIAA